MAVRRFTCLVAVAIGVVLGCATVDRPSPSQSLGPSPSLAPAVELDLVAEREAHSATSLSTGAVFVAGGRVIDGCGRATAETFLLAADGSTVRQGPQMAQPRDGHTATLVAGSKVVLVGGFPGEGAGALDSVEIFDSLTGDLELSEPLGVARGGHAAAPLGDGAVLVVIGAGGQSVEVLDIAAGTSRVVDSFSGRGSFATVTVWGSDGLLVLGGYDDRITIRRNFRVLSVSALNQAAR